MLSILLKPLTTSIFIVIGHFSGRDISSLGVKGLNDRTYKLISVEI